MGLIKLENLSPFKNNTGVVLISGKIGYIQEVINKHNLIQAASSEKVAQSSPIAVARSALIESTYDSGEFLEILEKVALRSFNSGCILFTVSLEVIKAFNIIQHKCPTVDSTYIEIYYNKKTDELDYIKRDKNQLHYALANGLSIRGGTLEDEPVEATFIRLSKSLTESGKLYE